jgi:general secretion pathway protein G
MLVVVLIVGVLVSLISAATLKALAKGNQTRTVSEIGNLAMAVENFRVKYGFYPPSRIHLCEQFGNYNQMNSFDVESIGYLTRMFPRLDTSAMGIWTTRGIDWNGNGVFDTPATGGDIVLEGDQCLVFFLGGIPANTGGPPACTGFSVNPNDPAFHVANGGDSTASLFAFATNRLAFAHVSGMPNQNVYYSYVDYYAAVDTTNFQLLSGRAYAYFSSYGRKNGYNRYFTAMARTAGLSDCQTIQGGVGGPVWPYAEAMVGTTPGVKTDRYVNPESFQIISAGADGPKVPGGGFGTGTMITGVDPMTGQLIGAPTWTASNPTAANPANSPGADDLSNFHDTFLGAGGR